ncbi:member of the karyopherin-beta [Elasticomyces elasticus]|nr:member of the karyopherin-beta [Elasticomyces elasticus]
MLTFCETLAEEVCKTDKATQSHWHFHERMEHDIEAAASLMRFCMNRSTMPNDATWLEALDCYNTWVSYAQSLWSTKPELWLPLRDLTQLALEYLLIDTGLSDAVDVFEDILDSSMDFLLPKHVEALSEIIRTRLGPLCIDQLNKQDSSGTHIGQLLIAFGNATAHTLVEERHTGASGEIIDLLQTLLCGPGYPGEDDEIIVLATEFWNTYIECTTDILFGLDHADTPWLHLIEKDIMQAVEALWLKLRVPIPEVIKEWDENSRNEFTMFRTDVKDLLQSAFRILDINLLRRVVELVLGALQSKAWRETEAACFCLNSIADSVIGAKLSDDILARVFSSSLFNEMADFSVHMPAMTRRTAVEMLSHYNVFIQRHTEILPSALNFLFGSLETASLANAAAKSITSLCFSCRYTLAGQLNTFLEQYQRFLSGPTADSYTKEKVIGAIAAIIQALPSEEAKAVPLTALLENVERDIIFALECAAEGEDDMAEMAGVTALQCLASIGKASQVPEDVPLDVDADRNQPSFWNLEEGKAVQQRIVACLRILEVLGNKGDVIDAVCAVLRSGFTETTPGPFVLPAQITVNFVQQTQLHTLHLEAVLSTACTLLTTHSGSRTKPIKTEATAILQHIASFIRDLQQPSTDPEIAQSCVDVVARLIPRYVDVLLGLQPVELLEHVFTFTILCLTGPDPLPKRSSTSFWASFIRLTNPQQYPDYSSPTAALPITPASVLQRFGQPLCLALIQQIGGDAQRSELDFICEPVKALVRNQPNARQWLEAALVDQSFPSKRVGDAEKKKFLLQVCGLRGAKATHGVVKEFWTACRGTVTSYAS